MKQILHIFVKDARHQWLEILLSLVVTAALVLTCHSRWSSGAMVYGATFSVSPLGLWRNLPDLLVVIVPISWWLLISPVIHEERLVGDRQFWITRPYDWKKLLAAKVLFLIAFLYVPLWAAQCVMLAEAGFSPLSSFRGLLYDSLGLTCALVLPLVALATVTRNFARMTLAVLGAAVSLIAIVLLASNAPSDRIAIPYGTEISFSFTLCLCLAVVLVQYARRNVRVSWALLGLLVVLFGGFSMGGAPDNAQMDRKYPRDQHMVEIAHFAYQQNEGTGPSAFVTQRRDRVGILIPVLVSGVPEGTVTIPDFLQVTLQAPNGARWTSVWQSFGVNKFFPGDNVVNTQFTMPRSTYDEFIGIALNVQVTLALTQARAGVPQRLTLGQPEFSVDGVGLCTPITGFSERPDEIGGLGCRSPLRRPELTLANSAWSNSPCSGKSPEPENSVQTAAWIGSLETEQAEIGLVPVSLSPVNFSNQFVTEANRPGGARHLCPGTPITFTRYTLSGRSRSTFSINGFQLPRLDAGQVRVINQD